MLVFAKTFSLCQKSIQAKIPLHGHGKPTGYGKAHLISAAPGPISIGPCNRVVSASYERVGEKGKNQVNKPKTKADIQNLILNTLSSSRTRTTTTTTTKP